MQKINMNTTYTISAVDDDDTVGTQPPAHTVSIPMQPRERRPDPKITTCSVGMFNLPGLIIDYNQYTAEEMAEMELWGQSNGATKMTDKLWSFRSAAKRDWFILRWG